MLCHDKRATHGALFAVGTKKKKHHITVFCSCWKSGRSFLANRSRGPPRRPPSHMKLVIGPRAPPSAPSPINLGDGAYSRCLRDHSCQLRVVPPAPNSSLCSPRPHIPGPGATGRWCSQHQCASPWRGRAVPQSWRERAPAAVPAAGRPLSLVFSATAVE
jgi:hypothetical protein